MKVPVELVFMALYSFLLLSSGLSGGVSLRPAVVNVGAVFTFNSVIGKVAKVAIDAAVEDVNSDPSVLRGTKLLVHKQDSNLSLFSGIIHGLQFMETGVVAVLGPQSSTIAHVISLVANELYVPLLSFAATDPTLSSLQYPFFVRTTQSDLFQMAAISEIVDYYQWKQVIALFTDDDLGRNGVAALGDKLAGRGCRISYKGALQPGAKRNEIVDLLVNVMSMESRIIVVHADLLSGSTIFAVAQELEMMRSGYVWIATDWLSSLLDTSGFDDPEIMKTVQGVVTLRQHTPNSGRKSNLISRWSKLVEKESTGKFRLNSYGLYAYDTVWIVAKAIDAFFDDDGIISFSNDSMMRGTQGGALHLDAMNVFDGGMLLLEKIKETDFAGVTGPVRFDSDGYLIYPAYDIINVIGTGMRTVGYWSNYSGLSVVPPETLYSKPPNKSSANQQLHNMIWPGETTMIPRGWVLPNNGKELRIGVPNRVSFGEFVSKSQITGMITGYCIDVFVAAIHLLPYAVPYKFIPFGDGDKNPSYMQLVEMVASGEFDGAVGDIAILTNRTKIADFTQPYIESGLAILAPVRKHNSSAWAFLQPFTLEMWLVTGSFFLFVGIVVWILEHRINDEFRGPPRKQLVTIFWFSFSTLFFSHREKTESTLARAVLIIWLFVVLIVQSSYTASLTSILTVQQLSSPIKGIDSLISSNEPIGFQVGSFTADYLTQQLSISRSRLKPLGSPEEYTRALELGPDNGGVAAIVDEQAYIDLFLATQCKFQIVGPEFTKQGWGFVFPLGSPLAVDMSTAILALSENGGLQRIHDKWLTTSACSSDTTELGSNRLNLSSFWGLFLICGTACFFALLIYFSVMLRRFIQTDSKEEAASSRDGSSTNWSSRSRSIAMFLSFVDGKEEGVCRSTTRQMHKETNNGPDIESSSQIVF